MSNLKRSAISGVKWQAANKVLQKAISVVTFAILARVLEPSTFGLFAMAFIFIDGLHLFKSFGIDTALIQQRDDIEKVADTASIIILISGCLIFCICYFAAPLFALFFRNQDVLSVVRALGVVFLCHSFSKVPSSLLIRDMRFRVSAIIDFAAAVANCVFAIWFALIWRNVWGLVWAYLIKQFVITGLSIYCSGYRFRWQFDLKIARKLLSYGQFMVGLGLLAYFSDQTKNIVVGRILGTALLGYFALATNIGNFISTHFTQLISGVMFPAYAVLQKEQEALKNAYLKTVKFVSMFSFPFSIALICLAEELVLTLYGQKWLSIVPLVRFYGCVQLVEPIVACSGPVYLGCGKPGYSFWLTLSSLLIRIPLLIILTMQWGLVGAVLPLLISNILLTPFHINLVKRFAQFSYREFFSQLYPSVICSGIMLAFILFVKGMMVWQSISVVLNHHVIQLFIFSSAGLAVYLLSIFLMDRTSTVEVKKMLLGQIG